MLTTIRNLLRLALPPGTTLRTDPEGNQSVARGVASLRATLPMFPDLREGNLALVTLAQALALDERLTLAHLVDRLADVPVVAIAVVGTVDSAAIERADRRYIALLELPIHADLRMIERDIQRLYTDPDLQTERRAAQFYVELTQALVAGEGVRGVVGLLAARTGQAAACYSATGRLRADAGGGAGRAVFQLLRPVAGEQHMLGQRVLVRTIGELGGLALAGPMLDAWDEAALDQAVAALALELSKEQAVKAVETRVRGDFLRTVLSGTVTDAASLHTQAAELGFDLHRPHTALVCEPLETTAEALRPHLQRVFKRHKLAAPLMLRGDALVAFCPSDEHTPLVPLVEALAVDSPLTAGVSGTVTGVAAWPRALGEAEQALLLGRQLFGPHSITAFADLGVYRLLLAQGDAPDLRRFYDDTLGALSKHDGAQGELIATLEGYFAELGNVSRAAERLHIHRNTLIYRLQRIAEITGIDWKHAEDQLALQLALKVHRVLRVLDDGNGQK